MDEYESLHLRGRIRALRRLCDASAVRVAARVEAIADRDVPEIDRPAIPGLGNYGPPGNVDRAYAVLRWQARRIATLSENYLQPPPPRIGSTIFGVSVDLAPLCRGMEDARRAAVRAELIAPPRITERRKLDDAIMWSYPPVPSELQHSDRARRHLYVAYSDCTRCDGYGVTPTAPHTEGYEPCRDCIARYDDHPLRQGYARALRAISDAASARYRESLIRRAKCGYSGSRTAQDRAIAALPAHVHQEERERLAPWLAGEHAKLRAAANTRGVFD